MGKGEAFDGISAAETGTVPAPNNNPPNTATIERFMIYRPSLERPQGGDHRSGTFGNY